MSEEQTKQAVQKRDHVAEAEAKSRPILERSRKIKSITDPEFSISFLGEIEAAAQAIGEGSVFFLQCKGRSAQGDAHLLAQGNPDKSDEMATVARSFFKEARACERWESDLRDELDRLRKMHHAATARPEAAGGVS